MAKNVDTSAAAAKWARVTAGRTSEYTQGVANPSVSWAAATQAAAGAYKAGVEQAIAANRFQSGVKAAGDATWQQNTMDKGPARFAEGVALAEPSYESGFAPYAAVIDAVNLPPRFPRGDARNMARVAAIAIALNKKRVGGK